MAARGETSVALTPWRGLPPALHYELEQVSKSEILRKLKQRFDGKTARDIRFRVEFNLTRSIVAVRRHSLEPAVTNPCPRCVIGRRPMEKNLIRRAWGEITALLIRAQSFPWEGCCSLWNE